MIALGGDGAALEQRPQELPRERAVDLRDQLRRADGDDLAARLAALRAEVDEPVGLLDPSRLCSITSIVLPASTSRCSTSSSFSMSAKWSPVVGSSRT